MNLRSLLRLLLLYALLFSSGACSSQTETTSAIKPQVLDDTYENVSTSHLPVPIVSSSTMDIGSGDLDGDGDLDLVLAMEADRNVILFNDAGNFTRFKQLPLQKTYNHPNVKGEDSEEIAIFDVERDGDLDLLFLTEDTHLHELLLNDGQGNFSFAEWQFPKTLPANALLVIDINQDQYLDVIAGNNGANQVYLNKQDGSFEEATDKIWPQNGDATQDLKAFDMDGDGDLDIIEGIEKGGNNLYLNEGGKFREVSERLPDLGTLETRKVLVGDLNGDHHPDLIFCNVNWNPGTVARNSVLLNDGTGNFLDKTEVYLPPNAEITLDGVLVDLDNDGRLDIVTTGGWATQNCHIYLNRLTESGSFEEIEHPLSKLSYPTGIAIHAEDIDNNGKIDFYIGVHKGADKLLLFKS